MQVALKAIALSVEPGGVVGSINIGGWVSTTGDNVITIELDGEVDKLQVRGRVVADGQNSNAIYISGDSPDLTTLQVMASHGRTDGRPYRLSATWFRPS